MPSLARWTLKTEHRYTAFDGRLYLERRPHLSPNWTARCCHANRQLYKTTKTPILSDAQRTAEEWFLDIQSRAKRGEPVSEPTIGLAFKAFIDRHEQDLLPSGASNRRKIANYRSTWKGSVKEFFGNLRLSEVTTLKLEEFRRERQRARKEKGLPSLTEKTLHEDIGLVRQCLKEALRQQWLKYLPQFPTEHIKHTSPDWFTQEQLDKLIVTSQNRLDSEGTGNARKRIRRQRTELHAFIWFMSHGCIRVDEALALRWKDVVPHPKNEHVPPFKRQYLVNIRKGKTGSRQGIGTLGVAIALNYLKKLYPDAQPEDKLFKHSHQRAMAQLLDAAKLRVDEQGRRRNAKTLRHTSIMLRFLYEPNISAFELSTFSGTSVAVLENYYLRHLTGQRVSDRLMERALAEYAQPKEKATLMWGTDDGRIMEATER
jgi:integrase